MTEQQNTPNVQVNAQYIKDFSFEAPKMPFILSQLTEAPHININIDVNASVVNKEQNLYTVDLIVKAEAKAKEEVAFICELTYGALVTLNLPEEHVKPVLLVEVSHLLFPFVRSLIANTTRESGLPPLSLNPIDFSALYRERIMAEANKEKAN